MSELKTTEAELTGRLEIRGGPDTTMDRLIHDALEAHRMRRELGELRTFEVKGNLGQLMVRWSDIQRILAD